MSPPDSDIPPIESDEWGMGGLAHPPRNVTPTMVVTNTAEETFIVRAVEIRHRASNDSRCFANSRCNRRRRLAMRDVSLSQPDAYFETVTLAAGGSPFALFALFARTVILSPVFNLANAASKRSRNSGRNAFKLRSLKRFQSLRSNAIGGLATRIVIPMRPLSTVVPESLPHDLFPLQVVEGVSYFLDTPQLGVVPAKEPGAPLLNVRVG